MGRLIDLVVGSLRGLAIGVLFILLVGGGYCGAQIMLVSLGAALEGHNPNLDFLLPAAGMLLVALVSGLLLKVLFHRNSWRRARRPDR